jgi:hypothetical protein
LTIKGVEGVVRRVILDLADWPQWPDSGLVPTADLYFKRSYWPEFLSQLPVEVRRRVRPLGLSIAADVERERISFPLHAHRARRAKDPDSRRAALRDLLKTFLFKLARKRDAGYALNLDKIPEPNWAVLATEPTVFLHTRLWNPEEHRVRYGRSVDALNRLRVSLVDALQRELGDRFVGGVIPNEYARQVADPRLLTRCPTDFSGYLETMGNSLIAVTERGLHESNGRRLAEYLAAGRCVVGEEMRFRPREAPINGRDLLLFSSVDECVESCIQAMTDPDRAVAIARSGRDYFRKFVDPVTQLLKILEEAGVRLKEESLSKSGPTSPPDF